MSALLMTALLLGAPEEAKPPARTYTLRYRCTKGMSYEDRTARMFKLDVYGGRDVERLHAEAEQVIRRTVLEVDRAGRATIERVEVVRDTRTVKQAADAEPETTKSPAQGKKFVWRRKRDGKAWALYDGKRDVTGDFAPLVQRLRNWRSARLPDEPVAVGSTWEVSAASFLEAVGQEVPEGVTGRAVYTLAAVDGDVARITFTFKETHRDGVRVCTGTESGEWRFDVVRGRDLSLEMKGIVEIDAGRIGSGKLWMKRTVTYADSAGGSRPRDG